MAVGADFSGSSSFIESTTGTDLTLNNGFTFVCLFRPDAVASTVVLLSFCDTSTVRAQLVVNGANAFFEDSTGAGEDTSGGITASTYHFLGLHKATGTATPEVTWTTDGSAWHTANLDNSWANLSGVITRLALGCENLAAGKSKFFDGQIAYAGLWNGDTALATIKTYIDYSLLAAKTGTQFFTGTSLISGGTMADSGVGNNETARSGITAGATTIPAWITNFPPATGTKARRYAPLLGPGAQGPLSWQWQQTPTITPPAAPAAVTYTPPAGQPPRRRLLRTPPRRQPAGLPPSGYAPRLVRAARRALLRLSPHEQPTGGIPERAPRPAARQAPRPRLLPLRRPRIPSVTPAIAVTGTAADTLDGVTSTASGTVQQNVTGTAANTLDGVASAATGTVVNPSGYTPPTAPARARRLLPIRRARAVQTTPTPAPPPRLAARAAGRLLPTRRARAAALLQRAAATAGTTAPAGRRRLLRLRRGAPTAIKLAPVTGSAANVLDGVTSSATGSVQQSVTGTAANTLQDVVSASNGVVANPVTGTSATTLSGVSSAASGQITITGTSARTLDGVSSSASGSVLTPVTGTGSATLQGVTSQATSAPIPPALLFPVEVRRPGPVTYYRPAPKRYRRPGPATYYRPIPKRLRRPPGEN